jgi:hypothetical protein
MATEYSFEAHGFQELTDRLNRGDTIMRVSLNEGLRAIGRLFVPFKGTGPLAEETPKRTGKLSRSTYTTVTGDPDNQELDILQPARSEEGDFYGLYVREGTKPHVIRPKKKQSLRFMVGDRIVFASRVNHPGTVANPYHIRVLNQLFPQVNEIVQKIGDNVTAYISGKGNITGG